MIALLLPCAWAAPLPLAVPGSGEGSFRATPVDPWLAAGLATAAALAPLLPAPDPGLPPGSAVVGDVLRDGPFRYRVHAPSHGWSVATDVLALGAAASALAPLEGAWDRDVARSSIRVQSVAMTLLLVEAGKRGFDRPRPWTELDPSLWPRGRDPSSPGAAWSMPSGHTALVGSASMSLATTNWLSRPGGHRWPDYAAFGVAAAATAATGYGRVRANAHWPTDTVVGGLVGASIGVAVPLLHALPSR